MPATAVTKSVVANEPGGRKREEIFVDIIEKISVTFSSSVSAVLNFVMIFFVSVISPNEHIIIFCKLDKSAKLFTKI